MAQALGQVLGALDGPRGPDVVHQVSVPSSWVREGGSVEVTLPRNLACAVCRGGGCDTCRRAGALSLRPRSEPLDVVTVPLPADVSEGRDVCIRVPEHGGSAREEGVPRGHLLLTFRLDEAPSAGVRFLSAAVPGPAKIADASLIARSLLAVAVLCLLFVGMLHLSGWL